MSMFKSSGKQWGTAPQNATIFFYSREIWNFENQVLILFRIIIEHDQDITLDPENLKSIW